MWNLRIEVSGSSQELFLIHSIHPILHPIGEPTTMGNAQATDKNQPPATIKEQRKDVETNEAEPSLNTPTEKDKNSRGPWFVAHEDYHTGKATLVPKHASKHNIEQDEQLHKVGYIFTRLYCDHDTKHAQPHVNKHLLPHRFDSLRKQTLTHLVSDTVLIPNLRQFDSSMQETEQLQRAMRQQTESLRAAFKNPKVNLLHKISRDIVGLSMQNKNVKMYRNYESKIVYGATMLVVIPISSEFLLSASVTDNSGTRSFRRYITHQYDICDAARTHEYSTNFARLKLSKFSARNINVQHLAKGGGSSHASVSDSILTIPQTLDNLTSINKAEKNVKEVLSVARKTSKNVELGPDFGRGKVALYSEVMSTGGSTAETIIVPLTKQWKLSQVFNLIRRASEKIVLCEMERGAISALTMTLDHADEDNVHVLSKIRDEH